MNLKSIILGVLIWVFWSIWVFFLIWNQTAQKITNIDLSSQVESKLNDIKDQVKSLSNKQTPWFFTTSNWRNQDKLEKINKIKDILDKEYFDPSMISGSKMWDAAMQAYVAGLWDPFTNYLTAKDNKSLQEELKWSSDFQWIWAYVTKVPEWIMIEQVIKWSPAQKAWIKPTDIILEANGTWLADLPLWKAVWLIKWPAWTEVELTIKRDWKIFKIKVKRDKVKITSVNGDVIEYKWKKIWYISISAIWEETYDQLLKVLDSMEGISWIILDLRWNGWWYLDKWFKIWALWWRKWDIIVQTKYRDKLYNKKYRTNKTGKLAWFPTIVLIDGFTASAWEIITAAIKENNEQTTKLVWTQTFWKGTIQTLKEFQDGSSLKYTIWKWFTPKWENVCKKWVLPWNWLKPDIEVKFDQETYKKTWKDNQKEKAEEILFKMINWWK